MIPVFANKKLLFRLGEKEHLVEPQLLGSAPEWIVEDPLFDLALKDGSITTTADLSKLEKSKVENGEYNKPGSINEGEKEEKNIEDMDVEELKAYASDNGIDLGKATSKDGIIAKIKESEITVQ